MAKEKEAYYFSHDANARNDEKTVALRMKHNWTGYGLYWAIIEKLRESTEYKLSTDYNLISFDLRADVALIKSIVTEFDLFVITKDGKSFYSESLLRRMEKKEEKSKKARESAMKRWGKNESNAKAMRTHSDGNAIKGKESKVNKRKDSKSASAPPKSLSERKIEFYNSLKQYVPKYGKEMVREFYDYWTEHGERDRKMKFEKEKTFGVSKRLVRWKKNESKFNGGGGDNIIEADLLE